MQAIRVHQYGPPEVMKVEEVPDPQPGEGQVLVRLKAAGVNPVETYIRSGNYGLLPDQLPFTPGSDGAGEVAAVGSGVTSCKPGDRVYVRGLGIKLNGTYAEMAVAPAGLVYPLSERLSFEQGAAVPVPYATAFLALEYANAKPGETVLVHGASGAVGTAAVQLAHSRGLRLIGSASGDDGRELARAQGCEWVIDHSAPDEAQAILQATDGKVADVVLEMLANVNLPRDLQVLAMHGRIVCIGNRGSVEINPRDAMRREATIRGMLLFNVPADELTRVHAALKSGFDSGELSPVVGRRFALSDAPQAHEAVLASGAHGKIVLHIS